MAILKKLNLQLFATPVQPTTSNTHVSDNFGQLLEPGLRKIFFETFKEIPEQYSKIYNMHKSSKAQEHDWGMGALGDWVERANGLDTVAYATISPGLERIYTHKAFTKGFMIERELYDDEQYRQINKFPKSLARAGRQHVEKNAMLPLIKGFDDVVAVPTSAIYDGKALFANDHPLLDSASVGDNLITGVLNVANLKIALQCMRETLDEAGNLVQMIPDILVVPPALEHTALEIVKSTHKPGTDFNDINTLAGKLRVVTMDYLGSAVGGSDTSWFVMDSKRHELNFFWRTKPEFKWAEDFDTIVSKYRGYMRYSFGLSDWRGIVGSAGL